MIICPSGVGALELHDCYYFGDMARTKNILDDPFVCNNKGECNNVSVKCCDIDTHICK